MYGTKDGATGNQKMGHRGKASQQWTMAPFSVGGLGAEDFHHLVAEVIDDFHGDAAGGRSWERARRVTVERLPGFGINFGLERGLETLVRVLGTEKIGVTDEKNSPRRSRYR